MTTIELKNKIHNYINQADERLLRIVNSVMESYLEDSEIKEDEIVGYTLDGEPLTLNEYTECNRKAVDSYHKGLYKTQKEILEKYQGS